MVWFGEKGEERETENGVKIKVRQTVRERWGQEGEKGEKTLPVVWPFGGRVWGGDRGAMYILYFLPSLFWFQETNENNFCLYVSVSSPQFGSESGGEMGESCIYCIFCQVCFDFKRQMFVNKHYFVAMLVNSQYLSLRFGFESAIWERIWGGDGGVMYILYFLPSVFWFQETNVCK